MSLIMIVGGGMIFTAVLGFLAGSLCDIPYRCRHKYSKWGHLIECYGGVYQFRRCAKCGKISSRLYGSTSKANIRLYDGREKKGGENESQS